MRTPNSLTLLVFGKMLDLRTPLPAETFGVADACLFGWAWFRYMQNGILAADAMVWNA